MIEMHPVRSSNIARVGLDAEAGALIVEFRNGSTYAVEASSEAELQDILGSASPGAWYDKFVRKAGRSVRRM